MNNNELDFYLGKLRIDSKIGSQFFNDEATYELLQRGFAKREKTQGNGVYDLVITDQGRSFIGFLKEQESKEKERKRDELSERAVKSAESSAEAAKISAKAANRGNIISIIAIIISLFSIFLAILQNYPSIINRIITK